MRARRKSARRLWPLALAVCLAPACGDEVYHVTASGTARPGAAAVDARPRADGAGRDADAGTAEGGASVAEVGAARADAAADGDAFATTLDAGPLDVAPESRDDAGACVRDADCPSPVSVCAVSRCDAGRCVTMPAPSGTKVLDVPADCHATICDGAGHVAGAVVAQSNVPLPNGPCRVGTCDALGRVGAAPLPAGTACAAAPGRSVCDGVGSCVECNRTQDCAPGLYCDTSHHCGSTPCTDLDCGGACPPCDLGKRCAIDEDCQSFACDVASATCIQNQCLDHVQDGNETDLDCGGGLCKGCELGQGCLLDSDCLSQACDAATSKCISDTCADHRADAYETDVDCGGAACESCSTGKKCKSSFDCMSGHFCNAQKVCQ
jgi:hypothetical protein